MDTVKIKVMIALFCVNKEKNLAKITLLSELASFKSQQIVYSTNRVQRAQKYTCRATLKLYLNIVMKLIAERL